MGVWLKMRSRFTLDSYSKWYDRINHEYVTVDSLFRTVNELDREVEELKQFKQSVTEVLMSWSQKELTAKQLGVVIAIMEEIGVEIE